MNTPQKRPLNKESDMMPARLSLYPPYRISDGVCSVGLPDTEARMLWVLMCRRGVTGEDLACAIWGGKQNWPASWRNGVATRLMRLRRNLEPFGWTVPRTKGWHSPRKKYRLVRLDECGGEA